MEIGILEQASYRKILKIARDIIQCTLMALEEVKAMHVNTPNYVIIGPHLLVLISTLSKNILN